MQVVKGLGETLVGAYSGRALSFVTKKSDIKNPKVLGYPSKRVGLFIKQSIIFRSDSNGEDLEGYAGAGLYDRFGPQPFWSILQTAQKISSMRKWTLQCL